MPQKKRGALKPGDRVRWKTSQGKTTGRVSKEVTNTTRVKGHKAVASQDNPQYIVRSEKSGKKAVHKQSALKKVR